MQKNYPKKRMLDKLKASLLLLMLVCFAGAAQAQNVYMHTGSMTVPSNGTINFYDSGGESHGPDYYWERWFQRNEEFTYTFNPGESGKKIKVTFNEFTAYLDNGGYNHAIGTDWSLRLNTAELSIYDGAEVNASNLITTYTGNMTGAFSVIANGPITFYFHSYGYREEGWQATVQCVDSYELQKPQISFEACSDAIVINANNKGAEIYYLLDQEPDPNDPLQGAELYEGPFSVDAGTTIYACAKQGNQNSAYASKEFTDNDVTPTPGAPTITRELNTITMTPAEISGEINETYYVWYTTDGSEPTATNGIRYNAPFEWDTPNTTFKAVTRALSCSDKMSTEIFELHFDDVKVPTPTITFPNGNATIACSMDDVTIYYTTDGSTPTTNSATYTAPFTVNYGTTVKAIAVMEDEDGSPLEGFEASDVASNIYVPEGGSGVGGGVVILDDREDHSWSYYSDGDQPVHSLKPADVKITYYGYGANTMTTTDTGDTPTVFAGLVGQDDVAVGPDAPGSRFIYLKTLENANEDGSGNEDGSCNYPYTLIPNPFSVRPTYGSGTIDIPTTVIDYRKVTSISEGSFLLVNENNSRAFTGGINNYQGTTTSVSIANSIISEIGEAAVITIQSVGSYYYLMVGNQYLYMSQNGNNYRLNLGTNPGNAYQWTITYQNNYFRFVNRTYNSRYLYFNNNNITTIGTANNSNLSLFKKTETQGSITIDAKYRGFYAWRVKSLSGVTISGHTVGDIIPAEEEIEFVAEPNSTDNEVEFEALWAQAYVVTSNNATGLNANVSYERNFVVGAAPGTTELNVPVTYSSYYPDGTQATNNQMDLGSFTLLADTKFEYMRLNGSGTTTANGHSLCFGRGITGGNNVQGISGTYDGDLSYTMRVESGTFGTLAYVAEINCTVSGRVQVKAIMGCDYDRATKTNSRLSVSNSANLFFTRDVAFSNASNKDQKVFDLVVKSGEYQKSYWTNTGDQTGFTYTHSMYCGANFGSSSNNAHYPGVRYVTIEGGALGNVNGGRGTRADGNNNNPGATTPGTDAKKVSFSLRIKKDAVINGCVFGGAANTSAWGSKRLVVTGGEVLSWIAGGANGTNTDNGDSRTRGAAYIYVGGNAKVGGPNAIRRNGTYGGQVFGAGRGNTNQAASMDSSYVVIADNAQILRKESEASGNVYGGGNIGYIAHKSNVYILGGTVGGSVFGGAYGNEFDIPTSNVYVEGGKVNGSVYGGSNDSGTVNNSNITMSNGTTENVFGGGLGTSTNIGTATDPGSATVTVSGGTINHNVYGGGEEGKVNGNTNVTVSGGSMKDVYGAGKGSTSSTAQVTGSTIVNISGGEITNVYGGGQAGDVVNGNSLASTVTVSNGNISGEVYGGGFKGKTTGNTEVDIKGGTIRGNVFGGAYGEANSVFVAGSHSVNIMGGRIFGSVYGGSRNANDALLFTGYDTAETAMSSVVNISAGQVDEQVYAAGYFGQTYGSVYVFIGKNAILNAPNCAPSFGDENENMYKPGKLLLAYNVWAGSDFGTFSGGTFTAPNISGYSNIYVDGEGYDTGTSDESAPTYMNIKGSLFGCGTSGDAGKLGRGIYVRNYGHANGASKNDYFPEPFSDATRTFFSIQRADTLVIDNSHVNFTGQARVNSLDATEKYAIYSFDKTVRMTSGSSLFLNAPVYQIIDFWSATVDDLYKGMDAKYAPIAYNGLGATGGPNDNKIRVNGGNYIEIYHDKMPMVEIVDDEPQTVNKPGYGMLNGFAHMMVASNSADNTCAYARPKQCDATPIDGSLDNPDDGGWVSYDSEKNTFDIDGNTVSDGSSDQMPYENHTTNSKAGEQYFRIWRAGGMYSEREGVLNAYADGTESFNYVDVTVKLPAWRSGSAYYKFETSGSGSNLNTTIDYGPDVMTYATAIASVNGTTQSWVHFVEASDQQLTGADANAQNQINQNPNVNFGLVTMAGEGMTLSSPVATQGGLIVCPESDQFLASVGDNGTVNRFNCSDNTVEPQVTFRLTYSNQISTNMTWDPMYVTLVQCDANGNITDIVKVSLTINTYTTINNTFTTQTYAIMDGNHPASAAYTAKVILPTFSLHDYTAEHLSQFTLTNVTFEPNNVDATSQDCWKPKGSSYDMTSFAMEIAASRNADNSDGWNGTATGIYDSHTNLSNGGILLGETGARTTFAFDFTLTYNGNNNGVAFNEDDEHPALLGTLTFTIRFTNYANGNPNDDYAQNLTIKVQVIRRGVGKVFYLDGQNGSNSNSALYPNDAALSLSYIFNRCGYMPGDIIYDVNTVDVTKNLEWSGSEFSGVTIYRYPGGHPLLSVQQTNQQGEPLYYTDETETETTTTQTDYPVMVTNPIVGNENNEAFTGAMVAVKSKGYLTLQDITLDGHMTAHTSPYSTTQNPLTDAAVTAASPMITVASGGTVIMTNGSVLCENNSTANGGAMAVDDGGTLKMNQNATITNNVTGGNGGAVYMAGTMIVSDAVQLINNMKGTSANNVYLVSEDDVIQIGTSSASDEFGPFTYTQQTDSDGHLLYWTDENQTEMTTDVTDYPVMIPAAQIGVTKTLYGNVDGYTEVVKVETTNEIEWLADPYVRPNVIIFHDGGMYQLEKYNDPTYLYWIGTWVTVQYWNPEYESNQVAGYDANNFSGHLNNIDTPEELAWLISYVNGLNGATAHPDAVATITADIDMDASIWVPIGNNSTHFKGTFEGNGHVITGIHSILVNDNAAMFGVTEGATIQNTVAVVEFNGNSINKGTFIGTMNGGTLANVEAAGNLIGKANTMNMGGLVGLAQAMEVANGDPQKPTIHSSFAVNTITAEKAETVVGGLVGTNGGDLYNSYSNVTMSGATQMGGLAGINNGHIENCYAIVGENTFPAFAYDNTAGEITVCYADQPNGYMTVPSTSNATLSGTYGAVQPDIKHLEYMFYDNLIAANTNTYVGDEGVTGYANYHTPIWNGLLSALNQWVRTKNGNTPTYSLWNRPINNKVNGDLPVLAFPKDNSMATLNSDGKYLQYSTGLDNLLDAYTADAGIFVYGAVTDVAKVPAANTVKVTINEDAVLLQAANPADFTATVGVTFDNSCKKAVDHLGNTLKYDWHFMSTPLSNALIGATYKDEDSHGFGSGVDITKMENGYFPNGLPVTTPGGENDVKWDLYTYYEPEYHWINLKRNKNNHYHYDLDNPQIVYNEADQASGAQSVFTPGKGYMMAISQDSYMNSTGVLNKGGEKVTLYNKEELTPVYNKGWNLVGNPYQAYLDLNEIKNRGSFYIYDADQGVFAPVTDGQSSNPCIPSLYIHPHQGFFMHSNAEDGGSDEFTFNYAWAKATKYDASYYRSSEDRINYPLVNIFAENEHGNRDLAVVEFNRPELGGATKVNCVRNTNFQIAASLEGQRYGLVFTPEGTERVPVHFTTEEDGTFTLTWNTHNGEFTSLLLVDNMTGTITDMLHTDHYTFEASAEDYASRFYLTYTVTGVDENGEGDGTFAFFDGSAWVVNGKGQLDVVDVQGRTLYSERLVNDKNRVSLNGVAAGVYLLRVSDGTNTMVQKIVVK